MDKLVAFNAQQVGNGFIVNETLNGDKGPNNIVVLHVKGSTLKKHLVALTKELVEDSQPPKEAA